MSRATGRRIKRKVTARMRKDIPTGSRITGRKIARKAKGRRNTKKRKKL